MEPEGAATPPASEREPSAAHEGLPRRLRLQQRREFLRVQRSGVKHHTRYFLVFVAPTASLGRGPAARAAPAGTGPAPDPARGLPSTRLGVTVTRKVGKAVKRNRIKRLVREAFRREHHALPSGLDMVFVAKRDAVDTTLEAVVHDVRALVQRLRAPQPRVGGRPGSPGSRGRGRSTPLGGSPARSR
jgi:ribonuclease P protein component